MLASETLVEIFSGRPMPIGESSESYEVEIWDATYTTLKRTISGLNSSSCIYMFAQQVADFGISIETVYVKVYQLSASLGRGYPLVASMTYVFSIDDPYFSLNSLLMHMNDTGMTDVMGSTVTLHGNAQRSSAHSVFGGYSLLLDGSGDYLSLPTATKFNFGSDDFTIQARIYILGWANNDSGIYQGSIITKDSSSSREMIFYLTGTATSYTTLGFGGFADSVNYTLVSGSFSFALNTWYEVAATRVGNLIYLFVNGDILNPGGTAFSRTIQTTSNTIKIGAHLFDVMYPLYLHAHIDEVRIKKGIGLYSDSYLISSSQFPDE